MKKEYVNPQTNAEETMRVNMLCASGGGVTPYENPNKGGGDPQDAI